MTMADEMRIFLVAAHNSSIKPLSGEDVEESIFPIADVVILSGDLTAIRPRWNSELTMIEGRTLIEHIDMCDFDLIRLEEPTHRGTEIFLISLQRRTSIRCLRFISRQH